LTCYTGPENISFDSATNRITALLDFDFTHIASPANEFFYPFPSFHGILSGPFEPKENEALCLAQLDGFKNPDPTLTNPEINYNLAKLWHSELIRLEILGPSNIEGIEEVSALYWFFLDVCPPYFLLPRLLGRTSEEQQQESKKETEARLEKYLERWGF
jgi:hypothetical protein